MSYITEKGLLADSNGESFEKNCFIHTAAPKVLSEQIKMIKEEMDKKIEEEKKMESAFKGEFGCLIQNGCINIPWDIDVKSCGFVWMIKNRHKRKTVFTFSKRFAEVNARDIWRWGECEFSEKGDWILPKIVLSFIKGRNCVWVGNIGFAELISDGEFRKTKKGFNISGIR